MPHPSGANAERIAYFLGQKNRETQSAKTNADSLDKAKLKLIKKMNKDMLMDTKESETSTSSTSKMGNAMVSSQQARGSVGSEEKVMPPPMEIGIVDLAQNINMTAIEGSRTRHELEIRFKHMGREESLYVNRKAYWRKDMLKIALRPEISERVSEEILRSNCAAPLIQKGEQREAYSSNYRAFNNKRYAKGLKNEHYGHAWLVDIGDGFKNFGQLLEILSKSK